MRLSDHMAGNGKALYTLRRLGTYLFEIVFDRLPAYDGVIYEGLGGCSSYVQDGKLYRNLDWNYSDLASFKVVCQEFTGISFMSGLTSTEQPTEKLLQLPYRMVDGVNKHGIMCSTHVLYNDWEAHGTGEIPLTQLPLLVLTRVRSMATLETDLAGVLENLYVPSAMAEMEYLIQVLVTDGTTTYVLRPRGTPDGDYEAVDITENPKLSNFRWVSEETAVRTELQIRPTGVERWNMMPCPLKELRFTKAYEAPTRLSEFIGIDETTKDSTDAELEEIYDRAHAAYLTRVRDGSTWQTMHSVVYAASGMKHLWVQENWTKDYCESENKMLKNVKNGLLSCGVLTASRSNQPGEYSDRETRYFERQTQKFVSQKAKYSSDYFTAQAQGLFANAPFTWTAVKMRFADVVRPSAAITRRFDDYKTILIAEPTIDYVRPGTKFVCMGSTWIATNPSNISNPVGNGIVQRCNAVWNYLDYYGNVISEPIIVSNTRADANDSDDQESLLITKGYFNVIAQYNEATKQLDTNSRMILGTGAYRVTGYSDFQTEFTGDYGSVRLLEFTVRYEEPNDTIDDMENHVAGGKAFSWEIDAQAKTVLRPGETAQITAGSRRNGEPVEISAEHPISYFYESSKPGIVNVDEHGVMYAAAEGEAVITVTLKENSAHRVYFALRVEEASTEPHVEFLGTVPEKIEAFSEVEIGAAYFDNGEQTDEPIRFILSGADRNAYDYEADGGRLLIRCWGGSDKPLRVTAECSGDSNTTEIILEGI